MRGVSQVTARLPLPHPTKKLGKVHRNFFFLEKSGVLTNRLRAVQLTLSFAQHASNLSSVHTQFVVKGNTKLHTVLSPKTILRGR